jgi:hypothetical protein
VRDYRATQQPHDIKDASAGAIMACGLLDLATATGRSAYREVALEGILRVPQPQDVDRAIDLATS